ncbi:unnamed protein product, partial [Didymodactylos carnosus]
AIQEIADKNWISYNGTMTCAVSWDLFQTKENLLNALKCLQPAQIQLLARYLFEYNRSARKGFPDLFVWNPNTKKCK